MIAPFDFATATEIVFGRGRVRELGHRVAELGSRVFLVTGAAPDRHRAALESLDATRLPLTGFGVSGEPTIEVACAGVEAAHSAQCDVVVGIGGGSVLDAAKAIAALVGNGGDPIDYLEVVGRGQPLARPSLPCVLVPTTSGTGSEVTRNAVLASSEHGVKVSLRAATMLPRLALVDPELTCSVPAAVTAATGLDALTQVIEPYVSCRSNPLTDALCVEGIRRAGRSLLRAYLDGNDIDAREDLAVTSLFGGLALANSKLGAVHGFAAPLGGTLGAPHGALCARLLPLVMSTNLRALREREPSHPAVERYVRIAELLNDRSGAAAEDGVGFVEELVSRLGIPPLARYGLTSASFPSLVAKARKASSMQGNPLPLTDAELEQILTGAL